MRKSVVADAAAYQTPGAHPVYVLTVDVVGGMTDATDDGVCHSWWLFLYLQQKLEGYVDSDKRSKPTAHYDVQIFKPIYFLVSNIDQGNRGSPPRLTVMSVPLCQPR